MTGSDLKQLRIAANLNQAMLAVMLGLWPSELASLEAQAQIPPGLAQWAREVCQRRIMKQAS